MRRVEYEPLKTLHRQQNLDIYAYPVGEGTEEDKKDREEQASHVHIIAAMFHTGNGPAAATKSQNMDDWSRCGTEGATAAAAWQLCIGSINQIQNANLHIAAAFGWRAKRVSRR